jgi:hypothetical protein
LSLTDRVVLDLEGFPVLFAEQEAVTPEENPPPDTTDLSDVRMHDAARQAARGLNTIDDNSMEKYLTKRAVDHESVDREKFVRMVRDQRNHDVVDIIDQHLRTGGPRMRGAWVRVVSPRGYLGKLVASLSPADISIVMHRLQAMGHDEEAIHKFFAGRIAEEDHAVAVTAKPAQPVPAGATK